MDHRITRFFTERPTAGGRILYWMQASARARDNLALTLAAGEAAARRLPLDVLFCLDASYPEANARSFAFLLDGLGDVSRNLGERGLSLTVALSPAVPAVTAAASRAAVVFFDRAYLPFARRQREEIALNVPCPVVMAEDNSSFPVNFVSDKDEWAAATLRNKLMRLVSVEPALPRSEIRARSRPDLLAEELASAGVGVLDRLPGRDLLAHAGGAGGLFPGIDRSVFPTPQRGGENAAWERWCDFRDNRLDSYDADRNDPNADGGSGLAAALHFGHISPVSILADLKARGMWREATSYRKAGEDPVSKFLDELVVRRDLALNYALFNRDVGTIGGIPPWARKTLDAHRGDPRTAVYDRAGWEAARTHDRAWNAAQHQLSSTGFMHGYMRMYWGKKILEWSATPEQAYLDALYLNNKYALDGRDPNSYAGVAWCFGKHDRPWGERAVYGTVRCMVESGLRRKFDLDEYIGRFTPPEGENHGAG